MNYSTNAVNYAEKQDLSNPEVNTYFNNTYFNSVEMDNTTLAWIHIIIVGKPWFQDVVSRAEKNNNNKFNCTWCYNCS